MSSKVKNPWLPVLKAMPDHVLEGQNWEETGVVYSIRHEGDDGWNWFEGEADPDASGDSTIREVFSGTALAIHLQAQHVLERELSEGGCAVLKLPDETEACQAFERAVLDELPGVNVGSMSSAYVISSRTEVRSILRGEDGAWSTYRGITTVTFSSDDGYEPEDANNTSQFVIAVEDASGEPADILFELDRVGLGVPESIEAVEKADPVAGAELRKARNEPCENEDRGEKG